MTKAAVVSRYVFAAQKFSSVLRFIFGRSKGVAALGLLQHSNSKSRSSAFGEGTTTKKATAKTKKATTNANAKCGGLSTALLTIKL
jgi:hypothetical protein